MSNDLGITTHPTTPAATRLRRTGWRDPRLWIGILLVTVSVVLGARLLAAADDTTAVWAAAHDLGAGTLVGSDDLEVRRVRFADSADLARYLSAEEPVPAEQVLIRGVGAGELLPAAALAERGDVDLLHLPLEVDPHQVPPAVRAGSVIDIYLGESLRSRDGERHSGPALQAVTVIEAPPASESFAITGARQLVVAVPEADAVAFQDLYNGLDNPDVRVLQRS